MSVIEIRNISKQFGKTMALHDVSVSFEPDRIYGLLGRNGAGKTTLINILTNKLFPDSGEVLIDGESAFENEDAQAKLYCMTEKNLHLPGMKVKDGFSWAREFHPSFDYDYAVSLAGQFDMDVKKKISKLSSGYTSVFKLILTLASGVPVLVFDEPVSGLDAVHRDQFYRLLIKHYSENGGTIVVSTHLIEEVAEILEQVIILKEGELILDEPVESVLQSSYSVSGEESNVDAYIRDRNVVHQESVGRFKTATIFGSSGKDDRRQIGELGLDVSPAKLQEVFISLTE